MKKAHISTHIAGVRRVVQRRHATGCQVHGRIAESGARCEDGSLVTEYGLLAVVAATISGVVIQWATGGALVTLFNALLQQARSLVGA